MSYESRLIRILSALIAMLILLTLACFASSALPLNSSAHSPRTRSRIRSVSRAEGLLYRSAGTPPREPTQGEPQVKLLRSALTALRLVLALVSTNASLSLSTLLSPAWNRAGISALHPAPVTISPNLALGIPTNRIPLSPGKIATENLTLLGAKSWTLPRPRSASLVPE